MNLLWYYWSPAHPTTQTLLPPATKLGQGYIFTGVCDSVNGGGMHGWGGVARGACMTGGGQGVHGQGGMCGWGACMAGGGGYAWWGCVWQGGMRDMHAMSPRADTTAMAYGQ